MFEIKNVSKQFEHDYALKGISMNIGSGLNFIIGSSGSGKTTLLKIISGMEQDFEGEVFYCGKSIKTLTAAEKSCYYNEVFAFVWQDFNLLDELTVLENIMLPQYLKQGEFEANKKAAMKVLQELKIKNLAFKKAGKLSGGQKQRTAIARELMKNPQVIIADEPTSALDVSSAKRIMDILRDISKNRMVIVVTHDTSLIDDKSNVYELDKGQLCSSPQEQIKNTYKSVARKPHKLSFSNAGKIAFCNIKSKIGRFAAAVSSFLVASVLLLLLLCGSIGESSQGAFDQLFETYGSSILDISIVGSFISAGDTSGQEEDNPKGEVTQDIDGLYDKYKADNRVEHIVFTQAFHEIKVTSDGKEYAVSESNSVPVVNKLTEGVMPMGDGNEVVIPNSFAKAMGLTDEEAIGKTLDFDAAVYNWESGEPVSVKVKTTVTIVGVVDTTVRYDMGDGQIGEYSVDDSFFFSKSALDEMRGQAKTEGTDISFTIRTKSPASLIEVKDELNGDGIVPIGRFELVEDMVRLNSQTTKQSSSAVIIIGFLSVAVVIGVALMTVLTRKREFGIYMVSGYNKRHLAGMTAMEILVTAVSASVVFLCASPVINLAAKAYWQVDILTGKWLFTGVILVFAMGILDYVITVIVTSGMKASNALKTGDR